MECVTDLPCFGEVELIHDGGQDFDDCEESLAFGGEFRVGDGMFQVPGFQPDLVAFGEGGESLVVT